MPSDDVRALLKYMGLPTRSHSQKFQILLVLCRYRYYFYVYVTGYFYV